MMLLLTMHLVPLAAACFQVRGVLSCLTSLGPWAAAAAAHLDLLSAAPGGSCGNEDDMSVDSCEEEDDDQQHDAPGTYNHGYIAIA